MTVYQQKMTYKGRARANHEAGEKSCDRTSTAVGAHNQAASRQERLGNPTMGHRLDHLAGHKQQHQQQPALQPRDDRQDSVTAQCYP